MDRSQLLTDILNNAPFPGETVYLERRGSDYSWRRLDVGRPLPVPDANDLTPDGWLFYSGSWPTEDPKRLPDHLDDMLAEMESMGGGQDRCRWPLDQPYPHRH